jgi:deazaflavin-dependent oxidoreductase (nitroreductase family)
MTDNDPIADALRRGGTIDMSTTGRSSGEARRIEIALFNFDGRLYISGSPGRRSWLANLAADPSLTIHLKGQVQADLPATARIISAEVERRPILERVCARWGRTADIEAFVASSPLIEVTLA